MNYDSLVVRGADIGPLPPIWSLVDFEPIEFT